MEDDIILPVASSGLFGKYSRNHLKKKCFNCALSSDDKFPSLTQSFRLPKRFYRACWGGWYIFTYLCVMASDITCKQNILTTICDDWKNRSKQNLHPVGDARTWFVNWMACCKTSCGVWVGSAWNRTAFSNSSILCSWGKSWLFLEQGKRKASNQVASRLCSALSRVASAYSFTPRERCVGLTVTCRLLWR